MESVARDHVQGRSAIREGYTAGDEPYSVKISVFNYIKLARIKIVAEHSLNIQVEHS
jgi:hypothetical protein